MTGIVSRREVLGMAPAVCGVAAVLGFSQTHRYALAVEDVRSENVDDGFPRQDLKSVEAAVTYSHFDLERVKRIISPLTGNVAVLSLRVLRLRSRCP